ncbi:MAG: TIGR03663 family protein [Roseiflexaceae bacterium]
MSIAELPPAAATSRLQPAQVADTPRFTLTVEHAIYAGLFLLSVLVHLWGLDNRALHHDETLHAAYSYYVLKGEGFVHDPLLHGPFLYFWGAFIYFLFGDSNYTARLAAALFGSVLTVLPYLIRRELGQRTALIASVGLLVSPVILYVGRFIRHDIYAVTFELLALISVVRYTSTHQSRWLYLGAASLALMFTTLETFFLYLAIFLPVVLGIFFYRVWKPGAGIVVGLGVLIALLVFVLPGYPERPFRTSDTVIRPNGEYICPSSANPNPADNPMNVARPGFLFGLPPLSTADNLYALCVRHQPDNDLGVYLIKLSQFFSHPAIEAALVFSLAAPGALYYFIWRRRDAEGMTPWERASTRGDLVVEAFASLASGRRWIYAALLFFGLYALLFSAFFTNPVGIISGTTGSLLYWMAQHEVERGAQPRHFYLTILTIYEPLMLAWGATGLIMVGRMGIAQLGQAIRNWRSPAEEPAEAPTQIDWSFAMPALIAWWLIGALFLYSWAGEKMPWLTIHIALPLTLLGSWALNRVITWWQTPDPNAPYPVAEPKIALITYLGIFGAVIGLCFLLITISIRSEGQQLSMLPFFPWIGLALLGLLTVGAAVLMGRRWAIGALAIGLTLTGLLYGARSAFQLNFRYGDVPREMMIYTQTSPDVRRVIDRLEQASIRRGGSMDMKIWYDNETVWDWYMRRFSGATEQPAGVIPAPSDDLKAMLLMQENLNNFNQQNLEGFRVQRFPLRWWFPEDQMYRLPENWMTREVTPDSPLLMRMLRTPTDGRTAAQFWNYIIFRNLHAPLGSSDFVLVVRPELADEIGLGTGELK